MPFNARSISISCAVISFFAVAVIGLFNNLAPFTCLKRSLTGALVIFIITTFAVRIINSILINAIAKSQMDEQKGTISDNEN